MTKSDVFAVLKQEAGAIKAFGATSLYVFGSTVRDTARPDSDLDAFVDYDRASKFSLIELVGIKQYLERRLSITVDLTTRDSLDPMLRSRIEATAEQIF